MLGWLKKLFGATDYEALAREADPAPEPAAAPARAAEPPPPARPPASEEQLWASHADTHRLLTDLEGHDYASLIRALLKMWHFRRHPAIGDLLARVTEHQLRATPRWTDEERDARLTALEAKPDPVQLGPLLRERVDLANGVVTTSLPAGRVYRLLSDWPDDPRIPRWALTCLENDVQDAGGDIWLHLAENHADPSTRRRAAALQLDTVYKRYNKRTNHYDSYQHTWDARWKQRTVRTAVGPPDDRLDCLTAALEGRESSWPSFADDVAAHRAELAALQASGDEEGAATYVAQHWDRLLGALRPAVVLRGLRFEAGLPAAVTLREDLSPGLLDALVRHPDWRSVRELSLPSKLPDARLVKLYDHRMRRRRLGLGREDRKRLVTDLAGQREVVRNVATWPELATVLRNKARHPLRGVHLSVQSEAFGKKAPKLGKSGVGRLDVLGLTSRHAEHLDVLRTTLADGVGRLEIRAVGGADPSTIAEAARGWADEVVAISYRRGEGLVTTTL
jgi:hypothetical protein